MARKIIHQLVDDVDGKTLEAGEGETVLFALDGKSYEIDLGPKNAEKLRSVLEPFVKAGRRVQGSGSARRQRGSGSGLDLQAVREWARKNGYTVSERGRVPEAVLEAYRQAN